MQYQAQPAFEFLSSVPATLNQKTWPPNFAGKKS